MAQTAIEIPDYVTVVEPTPAMPLPELTRVAADLLSASTDLPAPRCMSASAGGQEIELQFSSDRSTFHAMARWAERFGGTITGEPGTDADGSPYVRCEVTFDIEGARVKAYAYVQADKAT
jgi:hypothetical protein